MVHFKNHVIWRSDGTSRHAGLCQKIIFSKNIERIIRQDYKLIKLVSCRSTKLVNLLSEWLLNGEYSENAVLTSANWECVETIRSQPKSFIDMVKT